MNAGLLGEHLASPRTATKTNQNTALDTPPAEPGKSSSKEDFESFVKKDADAPNNDAAAAEDAIGAGQTERQLNAAADDRPRGNGTTTPTPVLNDGATLAADEALASQSLTVSADAVPTETPAEAALGRPRGEVLSDDARVTPSTADANAETILDPRGQPVKLAEQDSPLSEVETRLRNQANDPQNAFAETRQFVADDAEAGRIAARGEAMPADLADAQARQVATSQLPTDTALTPTAQRDVAQTSAEPLVTLGAATSTPNAAATVSTAGLTPTAPAIPIASPGDLTSVILNALQNGGDPQEQLVVQLDPPELGRVMIDFKFDAQGVQQVVVTSENPEALKRLREMHFELTEALRQQGLSDTNMSFRQEAEERPQDSWQPPERARQEAQFFAAEERRASPSAKSSDPRHQVRDRLDLLL